jgi:hypothetical protein
MGFNSAFKGLNGFIFKLIIRYYFFYGQQCFRIAGFCVEKLEHYDIKEDKMGGSCRLHGIDNQYIDNISWKT